MNNIEERVVFSKKLANELVDKGFEIIRTEVNIKDPKFRVFIFEKSPELDAVIDSYMKK